MSEARRQSTPRHATPRLRYITLVHFSCCPTVWFPPARLSGQCSYFLFLRPTALGWHEGRHTAPLPQSKCRLSSGVHILSHLTTAAGGWGGSDLPTSWRQWWAGGLSNLHLQTCSHSSYDFAFKREYTAQLEKNLPVRKLRALCHPHPWCGRASTSSTLHTSSPLPSALLRTCGGARLGPL